MNESKLKFFGNLNRVKDGLEQAQKEFGWLWDDGIVRISEDDIEQIGKALNKIQKYKTECMKIKERFKEIAIKDEGIENK